jgi:AcrR family transcriptional regulator
VFKNLFEEHKAERRGRILEGARRLIAKGGWERLNMRDLAAEARVSVPTVYNLVGGKAQLLQALVEQQFSETAAALGGVPVGETVIERARALCDAGHRVLMATPGYARELVHLFLTSEEALPIRRTLDRRNIDLMAALLRGGQAEGDLEPWIDANVVAGTMYTTYVANLIAWSQGELDDDALRVVTALGISLVLLGVTRGVARERLQAFIQDQQKEYDHVESDLAPSQPGRRRPRRPPRR